MELKKRIEIIEKEGVFSLQERRIRGISNTQKVKMHVKAFSVDDAYSWCDPNLKVTVLDGFDKPLSPRVWLSPTWKLRVDDF